MRVLLLIVLLTGCMNPVEMYRMQKENESLHNTIRHNENLKRNCAGTA